MNKFTQIKELFANDEGYINLSSSAIAYKRLSNAVKASIKLAVIYGKAGSGKSFLLQKVYDENGLEVIYFAQPFFNETDFYDELYRAALGGNKSFSGYEEFLRACKTELEDKKAIAVMLDEASFYPLDLLNKIRLLSDTMLFKFIFAVHKSEDESIFFKDYSNIAKKVKNHYKIDENKKIIMYAPTYRPFKGNPFFLKHELGPYEIDTELILEELKKKFSGEWVFVLRLHPSIAELIQKNSNEKVINVSDYDDIQELMCASDILINDYSSTMWDFVQTKKPCFIFAKDLDEYENSTGLYTQPSSWPFPLARNNQEFVENIRIFDNEKYLKDVEYYFNWMENYETGMACKQLCEMIYNIWKEENK